MSARRVVPEPWAEALVKAGLQDPRTGAASMSALAIESGLSVETVRRLVYGMGVPSEPTLSAVAEALNIPLPTIREWAGRPAGEQAPYSPPPEADQMNTRQRKAVDELIRSMVATPAVDVPASGKPGRSLSAAPTLAADDLVDERHETGEPDSEVLERAAAHPEADE